MEKIMSAVVLIVFLIGAVFGITIGHREGRVKGFFQGFNAMCQIACPGGHTEEIDGEYICICVESDVAEPKPTTIKI